jgi:hypothetical protein
VSGDDLPPAIRRSALTHALRAVHPDRKEAEVEDVVSGVTVGDDPGAGPDDPDTGHLVGVKVHPRGYLSTAKYALVTVDDEGAVVDAEACTRWELRRRIETAAE